MWVAVTKDKIEVSDQKFDEQVFEDDRYVYFGYGVTQHGIEEFFDALIRKKSPSVQAEDVEVHDVLSRFYRNGYFVCIVDKRTRDVTVYRDVAGLKSGYYHIGEEGIFVSTNVHQLAQRVHAEISRFWADCFIYNYFILDGNTLYENVFEVNIGETLRFDGASGKISRQQRPLPIAYQENDLSEEENIRLLREKTIRTHEKLAGGRNVVYLSGGVDSLAMLASLHEVCPDRLRAVSYKVKGGTQDETVYAQKAADSLSCRFDIVERNPQDSRMAADFEQKVLSCNNPYDGLFLFAPEKQEEGEVFFAGQDTRLHTPAVSEMDLLLMNKILKNNKVWGVKNKELVRFMIEFCRKYNKATRPLSAMLNPVAGLNYMFFSISPCKYKKFDFSRLHVRKLAEVMKITFDGNFSNYRSLYNYMVSQRWRKQYTNDIRYMVDMGHIEKTSVILPFYEPELASFSSTMPWSLATKKIQGFSKYTGKPETVDKYALRKAFAREFTESVLLRAKATSNDYLLLFNGVLKKKIQDILKADMQSSRSFLREYGYADYYQKHIQGNPHCFEVYRTIKTSLYLAFVSLYFKNLT
ncbi:MAG: hypothetical protein K2I87_06455 [Bacteroidales bacterium]|nr:hypothetical protein [Bacteroidales bacterium]